MFKYLKSAVKYFHNFVKKFKIITATIGKHISKANYYFNEINDCIENLEYIIKERNKEIGEHGIYSYNRRESSQENEKEKNGKNTSIFNFHDDEDEK